MLHPYLMTERTDAHYGYGIEIMKSAAFGKYYSHRGSIPGFRSILTYIPSLQLSIITLQNIVDNQEKNVRIPSLSDHGGFRNIYDKISDGQWSRKGRYVLLLQLRSKANDYRQSLSQQHKRDRRQ